MPARNGCALAQPDRDEEREGDADRGALDEVERAEQRELDQRELGDLAARHLRSRPAVR